MHTKGELKVIDYCLETASGFVNTKAIRPCISSYLIGSTLFTTLSNRTIERQKANAQRLVLCWNCHDDLVAACEELVDIVDNSPSDIDSFTTQPAKAAIAKAKP